MKITTLIKPTIEFKKVIHRNNVQLLLVFPFDTVIKSKIKSLNIFYWSQTLKGWYSNFSSEKIELIKNTLKGDVNYKFDESLKQKLSVNPKRKSRVISEANKDVIRSYIKFLEGRRYSKSTIRTYFTLVADFIEFFNETPLENLTHKDIDVYLGTVFAPKGYSISTQRQFISAIKLFVEFFADSKIDTIKLIRPKRSKILPTVLSKKEVIDLLKHTRNLKHRAIIAMIYSAGLRISELINLELKEIDIDRRQIVVKNAKGRKDRNIILAQSMLPLINNYLSTYNPQIYFAEGTTGKQYSAESIRSFLRKSCKRAQIKKRVTPHTLRHSYATHLLENGIDLRYIQELLGHVKPETTMIYTHVSKKDLLNIESPLDLVVKELMNSKTSNQIPRISENY